MAILQNPDNSETYYVELGNQSSETLLLLHGIGADIAMWQPQVQPYMDAGFHVLILDLFGHGQSSQLKTPQLSCWHNQITWLLDYLAIETCTVIGVSMGGVIAQSFVVEYPQRVAKLIVADSFGELRTPLEKLLGLSQVLGFTLFQLLGKRWLVKAINHTYRSTHRAQEYFGQVCLQMDFNQLILSRKAINRIDALEQLKNVTVPALVMVGANLGEAFIRINQKIADALPNAKFVILEKSMDPSNFVNPTEFNNQVLKFLGAPRAERF